MSDFSLEMENINKSFSSVSVLENVCFKVKRGEIHALVGGNGAGKSTLMKILTGIYTCDSGMVKIDGQEIDLKADNLVDKYNIRMIFQEMSLIPTMTVSENIFLRQISSGKGTNLINKKELDRRAKELLELFEIELDPSAIVGTLGVGYCQLVEIAKALSTDAKILIMDEPTASLTDSEVELLFSIMRKLKSQGVTIIYISHRMNEILRIADSITVLRDGRNVVTLDAKKATVDTVVDYIIGENAKKSFKRIEREYKGDGSNMLEVVNLNVDDNVKDISFNVKKGEVLGLAGLMGSGRTEIAESISGIRKPKKCDMLLDGKKISLHSVRQAIDEGIVLIPENRRSQGLILMHSVKENIVLPSLKNLSNGAILDEKKMNRLVNESIEELNIKTDDMHKTAELLSGGNQQKIVIAKWLKTNPRLLIMDEPTAGIDIGAKGEIVDVVRKFADTGNSVILISSELSELVAVCDRVLVVKNGRITNEINGEQINSEEVLQHAIQ